MASHDELAFDWSLLPPYEDYETWTQTDLQLAAELGKTLLERNKELESNLKHHQLIIDDQSQEIEYLTKQTVALRSVNESRLKLYENLEVSILDLERGNHRLSVENNSLKKQNKTLKTNSETLEGKCEELNKTVEDLNNRCEFERRKSERILQERIKLDEVKTEKIELKPVSRSKSEDCKNNADGEKTQYITSSEDISYAFGSQADDSLSNNVSSLNCDVLDSYAQDLQNDKSEDFLRLISELEATKRQYIIEQQRVAELEEQMNALIQENRTLQNRTAEIATNEEMKSMQDELSILDEVRFGKMCSRCLRNVDDDFTIADDVSIAETEDGDDHTLMETRNSDLQDLTNDQSLYRSAVVAMKISSAQENQMDQQHQNNAVDSPNPYRELVAKYEALMEVQRHPIHRNRQSNNIHEELVSSDFSSMNTAKEDDFQKKSCSTGAVRKTCTRTPTDFSEAETSSSGFADETSNKSTQTEETFLCTIADGDDKFSIYDDASPIDSRFRNKPEYRELFKEIFAILKKAAENKDDGEKLPLLDDTNPCFKVPPVTPAVEELPLFPDPETESVVSSVMSEQSVAVSEQSVAMSERITKQERKTIMDTVKKHIIEKSEQENKPPFGKQVLEDGRILTPLKREPLEYLSVSVNIRKKKKKSKNTSIDRSDSPILPTPPKIYYTSSGKKRRDLRPISNFNASPSQNSVGWNGNSMTIYNRSLRNSPSSPAATTSIIPRPRELEKILPKDVRRTSTASQDLHKLIKLDLSYAEVLRRSDSKYQPQRRK